MLDTSIYGKLVEDTRLMNNINEKRKSNQFVIYGTSIIRKELRATPKDAFYGAKKLRILLLNLYDNFITKENQDLKVNKLVEALSNDYFLEYKKNKGNLSNESIINDFMIIATATIYQLDVIVSDDERSMLSDKAVKSFKNVNKEYGLKDPKFKKYSQFRIELTR